LGNVLTLAAPNTFTGSTSINDGTLRLGHAMALQNSTVILSGGVLDVQNVNATLGGLSGTGNLDYKGSFLTIGNNGADTLYSGTLSTSTGTGGLTKIGSGMLTLAVSPSCFGSTIVAGGKLVLNNSAVTSSSFTVNSGGTLCINGTSLGLGNSYLQALSGGTVEYQNTTITGGYLRGRGIHKLLSGSTNIFNGVTINNGVVLQQNGNMVFTDVTNRSQIQCTAPMSWSGGINEASGTLTVNANCNVSEWENMGVIQINNGGILNNHLSNLTSGGGSRININPGGTLNANSADEGTSLRSPGESVSE
jgi:autotransporter-associated beta strand protein